MERLIEVTIAGRHIFSESEIKDAFALGDEASADELLEHAEELVRNLDTDTVVDLAHIETNFLYDYYNEGAGE